MYYYCLYYEFLRDRRYIDAASEDLKIESFATKETSNSIVEEPNQEPAKTETIVQFTGTRVKTQ